MWLCVCTLQWWRRIVRVWCKCRRRQFTSVPDNTGRRLLMIAVDQSINHGHCEHRLDNTSVSTCWTSLLTSRQTTVKTTSCGVIVMEEMGVESTATWMRCWRQLLQQDVDRLSSVAITDVINSSSSPTQTSFTSSSTDKRPTAPTSTFFYASTVTNVLV